ncbi:hypothetical protein AAC03nite_11600 [Alicyclobacillus acidoterrestris]|nr:hypothetical protein AAC03nite_11600 [Alicyclobacillus acidoterrestris]
MIGASLNLAALLLHHGAMPISLTGYHLIHPHARVPNVGSRHVITSTTKAWWLVDWIPVAPYLMSPGDILVGLGIMSLIYLNSSKRGEKVIAQNQ